MEQRRLARYEENIFPYFDNKTIITGVDRDLIPHPQHDEIHVIANGVDFEKFSYKGDPKEFDLIFTGNMSYPPNVDAAEFIVKQIFPKLRERFPELTVVLAGANPSQKVLALRQRGVIVTGWVDSIEEYYAKSKLFGGCFPPPGFVAAHTDNHPRLFQVSEAVIFSNTLNNRSACFMLFCLESAFRSSGLRNKQRRPNLLEIVFIAW